MSWSFCDVDITISFFFYSIVIAIKIINKKKRKYLRSISSCSRCVKRVFYAKFFLFWFNYFFLLNILYVIQRDFFDTRRNNNDLFVSLHRNTQCDVFSHNIYIFACFNIRIFWDYIFDIWSIDECDLSIHNISLLSIYTRTVCRDISICSSCLCSLILTS